MDESKDRQRILFDRSAIRVCISYLKDRTGKNLERLLSLPGSKLAYKHHVWSSISSKLTIEEFWRKELERIVWATKWGGSVDALVEYLIGLKERQWLSEVLRYLPEGHTFNSTVYLIGGYDNIVYGEDVALNLNSKPFHVDHREAVYYLIHELAHVGYFRYRRMPELAKMRTLHDLLDVMKLLTHLEGMGVISPFKLRIREGGLLDNDYKVLLNENERNERIHDYFIILSKLENEPNRELRDEDYKILEGMSAKPKRLWYITGGHMAQKIEDQRGTVTLQNIVKQGPEEFFRAYREIEDPLSL